MVELLDSPRMSELGGVTKSVIPAVVRHSSFGGAEGRAGTNLPLPAQIPTGIPVTANHHQGPRVTVTFTFGRADRPRN